MSRRPVPKPAGYHWDVPTAVIHPSNGRKSCRWCKGQVLPPKRNWCGNPACVEAWTFRTNPAEFRATVFKRDRGVCALCLSDTSHLDLNESWEQLRRTAEAWRRHGEYRKSREPALGPDGKPYPIEHWLGVIRDAMAWRVTHNVPIHESAWQVDHVVPVCRGGDWFDMANLRTVCTPCHRRLTETLNCELRSERRKHSEAKPKRKKVRVIKRRAG